MKDDRGLYYYPYPHNKSVRMYVKEENDMVFFRLYDVKDKTLWDEHDWVPYEAVLQAVNMYEEKGAFKPKLAYDITIAKALISET